MESKIHNSWVDPRSFKSDEEYVYAMKTAWGFAQAAQQIFEFVDMMQQQAEQLSKKEKGEVTDKLRESLS